MPTIVGDKTSEADQRGLAMVCVGVAKADDAGDRALEQAGVSAGRLPAGRSHRSQAGPGRPDRHPEPQTTPPSWDHEMLAGLAPERLSERLDISRTFVQHLSDEESTPAEVRAGAREQLENSGMFRTDEAMATVLSGFLARTAGQNPDPKALEAATRLELENLRKSVMDDVERQLADAYGCGN